MNTQTENAKSKKPTPVVSLRARDGSLIEMVYRRDEGRTALVVSHGNTWREESLVSIEDREYVPFSPENNLLTHRVIMLASRVGKESPDEVLVGDVRAFIHRYVDLGENFEEVVAHYVLLTWVYDAFNELPYLRVRGHYGSGKSRFLLAVGALCYKPIFASGASTISPIFRLLDQIGGTLVFDEADFWASDERSEVVKILNNGNARGFPVLRNDVSPTKEFNPRAFDIFGPKIVATRHAFEDEALESRCLTERLGSKTIRADVPISLPREFHLEAEELRNRLLAYRLRRLADFENKTLAPIPGLAPRRAQILAPLLAVAASEESRQRLFDYAVSEAETVRDSWAEAEERMLRSLGALLESSEPLTLSGIAKRFSEDWGERYGAAVEPRWVGFVLRRLGLTPQKTRGVYVLPLSEMPRVQELIASRTASAAAA